MKPFFTAFSIATLLALLIVADRERGPSPQDRVSDPSDASSARLESKRLKTVWAQTAADSKRRPSDSLQAVFPELDEHVADWRTFKPATFVLQLDENLRVPFDVTALQADLRRTVLTARLGEADAADRALAGAYLVATSVASDRWDALVVLPGMEYRVTVRGGHATVDEHVDHGMVCATDLPPPVAEPAGPSSLAGKSSQAAPPPGLTVDVLFLYNAEALADRKGDVLAIDADCSNYIAASNAVLANSRIGGFAWRYLGVEAAPGYAATEHTLDDLRAMRGTGAIAGFVEERQRTRGADQVVMLAGGRKLDAVGRAWVGGSVAHSVVSYPYATYGEGFRSSSVTSYTTVCHEMAHNFGCNHQREDASTEAKDGDGKYHYAHVHRGRYGLNGTIMAVYLNATNMTRIPYFSSAEVSFEGAPLGVGQHDPRAALNARILEENAGRIAALHNPPTPPAIIEHPQSLTIITGETATFAVRASGENLSYAWSRNGTPLASHGGTDRLEIANAAPALAGDYTVTVSNRHGAVTSFAATLTVNSRPGAERPSESPVGDTAGPVIGNDTFSSSPNPLTPPPPKAGSAEGSGGGSLSGAFALAAAALLSLRFLRADQRRARRPSDEP